MNTKRAISRCGKGENGCPMSKRSCKACKATGRRKITTKQRKDFGEEGENGPFQGAERTKTAAQCLNARAKRVKLLEEEK